MGGRAGGWAGLAHSGVVGSFCDSLDSLCSTAYRVKITTGHQPDAGTTAMVWLQLYGTVGAPLTLTRVLACVDSRIACNRKSTAQQLD